MGSAEKIVHLGRIWHLALDGNVSYIHTDHADTLGVHRHSTCTLRRLGTAALSRRMDSNYCIFGPGILNLIPERKENT